MIDTLQLTNIEVDGINKKDYPDFCDAYISRAFWKNGGELSEKDLDELNENGQFVHEQVWKWLY